MRATAWISWFAYPKSADGDALIPAIDSQCLVEVIRRDGEKRRGIAEQFNWFSLPERTERDVVAYRIIWEE